MDASFRGKGYGTELVKAALSLGNDFVVSSMSASSERAFRSAGMRDLSSLTFYEMDLRWCNPLSLGVRLLRAVLRCVGIEARACTELAQALDRLLLPAICACFYVLLTPWTHRQSRLLAEHCFVESRPPRFPARMTQADTDYVFLRDDKAVNWMLAFPWPVAKKAASFDDRSYFFTPLCDSFDFKVYSSPDAGCAVFSVARANGAITLKTLDTTTPHAITALLTVKRAAELRAPRVCVPPETAAVLRTNPLVRLFLKPRSRSYLYYPSSPDSPLAKNSARIRVSWCDGENPFA